MSIKCNWCKESFEAENVRDKYCPGCEEKIFDLQGIIGDYFSNFIDHLEQIVASTTISDRQFENVKRLIQREVGKRWADAQVHTELLQIGKITVDEFWVRWRNVRQFLIGRLLTIIESLGLSVGEKPTKDIVYNYADNLMNNLSGVIMTHTGHLDKDKDKV